MTEENKTFDPWEGAFNKQDQQKKEREDSKNFSGGFDYEEIVYEGLAVDKPVAFRIVGNPAEYRAEPSDAKIVLQSKMVKDGDKSKSKINWKFTEQKGKYVIDPDWILSKLYNKVMEKKFVKYTDADIDSKEIVKSEDGKIRNTRGYEGQYKDLHTETKCYKRLKFNKLPSDTKTFGDAYPSTRIVMNVISRMDDWGQKNKHTKILSTKVGTKEVVSDTGEKSIIYFPETGISKSMYDELLGYIRQIGINPLATDFIITRTFNNEKYSQTIFDGSGMLKLGRGDKKILGVIQDGIITDEECNYEKYDLDKLFKPASYNKLKNSLTGLFKLYDLEFNDNLYDELCLLAEEEKKNSENSSEDNEDLIDKNIEVTAEDVVKQRQRREIKSIDLSLLPFWNNLDNDDKKDMQENIESFISIDDFKFKSDTAIAPCSACGRKLPNTVLVCPFCGTTL